VLPAGSDISTMRNWALVPPPKSCSASFAGATEAPSSQAAVMVCRRSKTGWPSTGPVTNSRLTSAVPEEVAPSNVSRALIDWISIGTACKPSTMAGGGARSKFVATVNLRSGSIPGPHVHHQRDTTGGLPVGPAQRHLQFDAVAGPRFLRDLDIQGAFNLRAGLQIDRKTGEAPLVEDDLRGFPRRFDQACCALELHLYRRSVGMPDVDRRAGRKVQPQPGRLDRARR